MGNNAKMMDTESVDQILGEVQRLQTTMKYADVGYDELIFEGLNKGLIMPRRISKKLSFSIFTILIVVGVLPLCMIMKIPLEALPWAIAASDASILMIAVSYVTGQAKIDVQAVYGARGFDPSVARDGVKPEYPDRGTAKRSEARRPRAGEGFDYAGPDQDRPSDPAYHGKIPV